MLPVNVKILRLPEVKSRTGLSRSSIYAFMKAGTFPASVRLGKRSIGWPESAIADWIEQRLHSAAVE